MQEMLSGLTPGERRILRLVVTGATNREVGARLCLSPKTVETHLTHMYRKLDVRSRAELAYRAGLAEGWADFYRVRHEPEPVEEATVRRATALAVVQTA